MPTESPTAQVTNTVALDDFKNTPAFSVTDIFDLGAPAPLPNRGSSSKWILVPIALLALLLPVLGASLILVALVERFVLRNIPAANRWLGLTPSVAAG